MTLDLWDGLQRRLQSDLTVGESREPALVGMLSDLTERSKPRVSVVKGVKRPYGAEKAESRL